MVQFVPLYFKEGLTILNRTGKHTQTEYIHIGSSRK